MSMIDRAAAYNVQQRKAEQANASILQQQSQSPAYGQNSATPNVGSPKNIPGPVLSTPSSATANTPRPLKESPPTKDEASSSSDPSDDSDVDDDDDSQKWYSGSVPLGLEDDKYWLSELQVFLRSNFAEAFGATEEDIAAPMHGRNKPIALGQVGIRCMHCKRKHFRSILIL